MTSLGPRVAVALCCLLAGCGTTPTDTRAGTDTLTPVAVPTSPPTVAAAPTPRAATPTPRAEEELAPGVTGAGVEEPFRLAAAHRRGLSNRTFRLVRTLNVTRENGTVLRRTTRRATVAPNAERYRVVDTAVDTDAYPVRAVAPRIELWWAGGPALFRLSGDGEVRYRRVDGFPLRGPAEDLTLRDRIAGLLSAVDTTVVGREPGEPVRVILVASGVETDAVLDVPILLDRPRNVSLTLEVDVNGVVRAYRLGYDATFEGERVRVSRRARFAFVDGPVEPPAWRERALNASGPSGPRPDTPGP
jgi:hypothetical protein